MNTNNNNNMKTNKLIKIRQEYFRIFEKFKTCHRPKNLPPTEISKIRSQQNRAKIK